MGGQEGARVLNTGLSGTMHKVNEHALKLQQNKSLPYFTCPLDTHNLTSLSAVAVFRRSQVLQGFWKSIREAGISFVSKFIITGKVMPLHVPSWHSSLWFSVCQTGELITEMSLVWEMKIKLWLQIEKKKENICSHAPGWWCAYVFCYIMFNIINKETQSVISICKNMNKL